MCRRRKDKDRDKKSTKGWKSLGSTSTSVWEAQSTSTKCLGSTSASQTLLTFCTVSVGGGAAAGELRSRGPCCMVNYKKYSSCREPPELGPWRQKLTGSGMHRSSPCGRISRARARSPSPSILISPTPSSLYHPSPHQSHLTLLFCSHKPPSLPLAHLQTSVPTL